jgi:hypothetical protein
MPVDEERRPDSTWPRLDPVTQRLICRNCWDTCHDDCQAGTNPRPEVCQCGHHETESSGPIDWTGRYATTMDDLMFLAASEPNPKVEQTEKPAYRYEDCLNWAVRAYKLAYWLDGYDNQDDYDKWIVKLRKLFFGPNYLPGSPSQAIDMSDLRNRRVPGRPN